MKYLYFLPALKGTRRSIVRSERNKRVKMYPTREEREDDAARALKDVT